MTLSGFVMALAWFKMGIADALVARNPIVSAKTVVLIKSSLPCFRNRCCAWSGLEYGD
jgi:hypothetical protein